MTNTIDEEDIRIEAVLKELVCDGRILAKCPICDIPLNSEEYLKSKCDQCGDILHSEIRFMSIEHQPSC